MKNRSKDYIRAWNSKDFNLMRTVTSTDFERNVNGEIRSNSHQGLEETMHSWHIAVSNFNIEVREMIVKGSKSYTRWTGTGTNTGMYGENPPTGKKGKTEGFMVLTFNQDGKAIREEVFYDVLGVVEDWGYTLTPPIME
ncbi:ester cyclase [Flavobacteriaceae bacterium TP-CH-4]|uniref:Ester cyclase n=1 Tax=Pelagihabitans pacificus TaxID=2696054 RepID=A0A967E6R9_9FLAO|nr:ester cyclase [Pelagihabitans pacificus]NHF59464.1 ester cyclase [Pelagihabitans pacificus]